MIIHTKSLAIATTVTIWFIVAITVLMELFEEAVKPPLVALTGHHWVSKGALAVALFAVTYALGAWLTKDDHGNVRPVAAAIGSAVAGGLIIFFFFVWHFFSA